MCDQEPFAAEGRKVARLRPRAAETLELSQIQGVSSRTSLGQVGFLVSSSIERASEYRRLAERLRGLSDRSALPEARAELLWLAQSYERLARESDGGMLADSHAVREYSLRSRSGGAIPD